MTAECDDVSRDRFTNGDGNNPDSMLSELSVPRQLILLGCLLVGFIGCKPKNERALLVARETFAELRVIKGDVTISEVGGHRRTPYPRERLAAGAQLTLAADSMALMRDDRGATWLIAGPAETRITHDAVAVAFGKIFIDTQGGPAVSLQTAQGRVEASEGRSSVVITDNGHLEAYALRGTVRHAALRASAGEMLSLDATRAPEIRKLTTWQDWTSGLATADPEAQPAPYGIGTVGARSAGDVGKPRFSLVIQRLDVRVRIDNDYAETEVDETFANPSASVVEGLFSFRVPENAVLHRFGVDRDGLLVWGRPKEKRSAAAQYQNNVFEGSSEDPALLEWVQRGVYQARLYPIDGGETRRVVTRYGEWLARHGEHGERRLYVYPMAATGAAGTLPRIEEMTIQIDWAKAHATRMRAPLGAVVRGKRLVVKGFDVVPRSDVALELFDAGHQEMVAYRAKHRLTRDDAPMDAPPDFAEQSSKDEADYVLLPLTPPKLDKLEPGLDLSVVVDSSAATEPAAMAIGRKLVEALFTALGPTDRAALFTGDTTLRPVSAESAQLTQLDETRRKAWLAALAAAPVGGATDLGTMLAEAAERLEPRRRSAVIYIGDGRPSVGELIPKSLHERLARLPATARIFAVGVGSQVNRTLLSSLVRGAPLETVQNGYEAAEAALRLLEAATVPTWHGATLRLAGVDRLLPRAIPTVAAGEPALVVGRIAGPRLGDRLEITSPTGTRSVPLRIVNLDDDGDLRRRWGDGRLSELVEQQSGRLAMVDLARRYGLVTPWTSLYVATKGEAERSRSTSLSGITREAERESQAQRLAHWRPWGMMGSLGMLRSATEGEGDALAVASAASRAPAGPAGSKEGGDGTRAKGEEGSMGNPRSTNRRYSVSGGPKDNPDPHIARAAALREAQEFGMIGLLNTGAKDADTDVADSTGAASPSEPSNPESANGEYSRSERPPAPAAEEPASDTAQEARAPGPGKAKSGTLATNDRDPLAVAMEASPKRAMIARASAPAIAGTGTGAGFGAGHGRLSGGHALREPKIQMGNVDLVGRETAAPVASSGTPPLAKRKPETPKQPIVQLSHELTPCSAASDLPLNERRKLWRERLGASSTAGTVREIYANAIRNCEAPGWYERQLLLYAMVDRLGSVAERVQLYLLLVRSPDAAAVVYRAILARIQDARGLREFHAALGIKSVTPELVRALLQRASTLSTRVKVLRGVVHQWPDDFELMLQLLDAYEDANDMGAGHALARQLRRRADASAHVRTLVGEFYWRCSERALAQHQPAEQLRELEEARRTFGEIVEFAPDDPVARRRLGDLLRSHHWYDEALRQYETLRDLLPDDPTVHLLIASAAQGVGKTEEALRWSEKAAASAAPDSQSDLERAARATSSAFLAWAREDAILAGQPADAERLLLRGRKLATNVSAGTSSDPTGIRFILTWEHPELRPALYGITPAGPVPAQPISPLGVAEQFATIEYPRVELRLDPDDVTRIARLGAEVVLTAIVGDGSAEPHATRKRLRFGDLRHPKPTLRIAYVNGALEEESL